MVAALILEACGTKGGSRLLARELGIGPRDVQGCWVVPLGLSALLPWVLGVLFRNVGI